MGKEEGAQNGCLRHTIRGPVLAGLAEPSPGRRCGREEICSFGANPTPLSLPRPDTGAQTSARLYTSIVKTATISATDFHGKTPFDGERWPLPHPWIPACAGMTVGKAGRNDGLVGPGLRPRSATAQALRRYDERRPLEGPQGLLIFRRIPLMVSLSNHQPALRQAQGEREYN